uniref:Gag-Pol polyprotein n=1 Tax=Monodelphis domestica TaxID=13616 RepID=K7E2C3_MONDO
MGVSGITQRVKRLPPRMVSVGPLEVQHSFLLMPDSPLNLLGRDLLCKLRATITCSPDGSLSLEVPEESLNLLPVLLSENQEAKEPSIFEIPKDIPESLWATSSSDVGLLKSAVPVQIKTKSSPPPSIPQYPLSKEAIEGITPVINSLIEQGIIIPCKSEYNTPILPIKKPKKGPDGKHIYRFVQDLRAVNNHVIKRHSVVSNIHTIISSIPSTATYFTVVDLCSAFFSIPIHENSRHIFAFTWKGSQYTWCRLPQGYVESPSLFEQILSQDTDNITFKNSKLIKYVDDLLLASTDAETCQEDSKHLLLELHKRGHKISKDKVQWCLQKVEYLGFILTAGARYISPKRIENIQKLSAPTTKKQLRAILGATGFCRQWIPCYGEITKPLIALTKDSVTEPLKLEPEHLSALTDLKKAIMSAPALGIPDYNKPFTLYVHERRGVASGVLTQTLGPSQRPIAYYSAQLDPVAAGAPPCLRGVAATALLVTKTVDLVLGCPLTIMCPHEIEALLVKHRTQAFSDQRITRYEITLLNSENITLKRCSTLNPATLLPDLPTSGEPLHNCETLVSMAEKPRDNLLDTPLDNADLILFTDGSSFMRDGIRYTGAAVVSEFATEWSASLPSNISAQGAELIALKQACIIAKDKKATIYTDSRYAFGICHSVGMLWLQRGFLTSAGKSIANAEIINEVLSALKLPKALAVVHCSAHTGGSDPVSRGNDRADAAAKLAAIEGPGLILTLTTTDNLNLSLSYNEKEVEKWKQKFKAKQINGVWVSPEGKPLLPRSFYNQICQSIHKNGHFGTQGIVDSVKRVWIAPGITTVASKVCSACPICQAYNQHAYRGKAFGGRPLAYTPFEHLQIDFITMPKAGRYKFCLVIVDQLTRWPEAFPTTRATADFVAKILLKEIIPRFGLPARIDSDRGSHFTDSVLNQIYSCLGITPKFHVPYHPQSSGQVERMNKELKTMIGKLCTETHLKWPEILPLALFYLRSRPRGDLHISPFEMLFGHPPIQAKPFSPAYTSLLGGDITIASYIQELQHKLRELHESGAAVQAGPLDFSLHDLNPGDKVYIKNFKRTGATEPSWEGPFQILLTTPTSIKIGERDSWIHCSHVKKASSAETD